MFNAEEPILLVLATGLFSKIGEFFNELRYSLSDGLLYLGGPIDMAVALFDIAITAFVVYFILLLLRDSRAWQLLRGIILIVVFAFVSSAIGLNTIGFMLNRTISILAIAIIVIFQPELRRTLEAVGRNRLTYGTWDSHVSHPGVHQMIENIVNACEWMSSTRTGALIIIERNTKLGELHEQENAVRVDATVSSALLRQIFYTGSPLHDGAVIIRDGRVAAARVHIPLSDNYHLRRDFGLRHRAAVGASEMGDAVAVVVSEEKGTISLAIDGVLHVLGNVDALRTQLHRLLGASAGEEDRTVRGWFRRFFRNGTADESPDRDDDGEEILSPGHKADSRPGAAHVEKDYDKADEAEAPSDAAANGGAPVIFDENENGEESIGKRQHKVLRNRRIGSMLSRRQRMGLAILSIVIACFMWVFVQVTVNPVTTKSFIVPLAHYGLEKAHERGFGIQSFPVANVQVTLRGRQQVLADIAPGKIAAYIDVSEVNRAGIVQLPVKVDTETLLYTKTELLLPVSVTVNVYERISDTP